MPEDLLSAPGVKPPRTIRDLVRCARAEVVMRQRVYPGLVRKGTMTEAAMNEEIGRMQDIVTVLEKLEPIVGSYEGQKVDPDSLVAFLRGER